MRRAELPRRLHTGVHRGALRQEPWGERDMMRTEVASGCGGGRKQTVGWLGWMVAFPALGSEADEVRAAGPGAASPRGVQPVGADESAAASPKPSCSTKRAFCWTGPSTQTGIDAAGVSSTPSITSPREYWEGRFTTRPDAPSSLC